MSKNIGILGTGAIGSSIGADLTKAGHDVMLIDQWPAHIEAMKANGLRILFPDEELHTSVRAFHLCELSAVRPNFDIVFLACKSYDNCWMVELIKPYLKSDGVLVVAQNGLNDEWVAPLIGYERDIGCVVELPAELFEPGQVRRKTDRAHTLFAVGELHGRITPRLQEVAQIFSAVAKIEITTNIWGAKWSKLAFNTIGSARTVTRSVTRTPGGELAETPEIEALFMKVGQEAIQVGRALGYTLEPIMGLTADDLLGPTDEILKNMLRSFSLLKEQSQGSSKVSAKGVGHVSQDILKGRRTDIGYINGLVVKKGLEAGVPTPLNEAVTSIDKQIEQGTLKPDISNLKILEQCV